MNGQDKTSVVSFLSETAHHVEKSSAPAVDDIVSKLNLELVLIKLTPDISQSTRTDFWETTNKPSKNPNYDVAVHIYSGHMIQGVVYVVSGKRVSEPLHMFREQYEFVRTLHAAHAIDNFAVAVPRDSNINRLPPSLQMYQLFSSTNKNRSDMIRKINRVRQFFYTHDMGDAIDTASQERVKP